MVRALARLACEESGQDVVEYALLAAFLGCVGVLAWQGVRNGLHNGYVGWDASAQTLGACTPDPGGGGC
jgi:Flp pilus assembly pilin Flp